MKIVTAQELRTLKRDDDPLANVIAAINTRLKERHGLGKTTALIGFIGETMAFSRLSDNMRAGIESTLKLSGYKVVPGPAPNTITVSWTGEENEED